MSTKDTEKKEEKSCYDNIKDMIDYNADIFERNGDGLLELEKRIERNQSYSKFVLFVAVHCIQGSKNFSVKDAAFAINKDDGYVQKIIDKFVNERLLRKIKTSRKNFYSINFEEDYLRDFMILFKKAKDERDSWK